MFGMTASATNVKTESMNVITLIRSEWTTFGKRTNIMQNKNIYHMIKKTRF